MLDDAKLAQISAKRRILVIEYLYFSIFGINFAAGFQILDKRLLIFAKRIFSKNKLECSAGGQRNVVKQWQVFCLYLF